MNRASALAGSAASTTGAALNGIASGAQAPPTTGAGAGSSGHAASSTTGSGAAQAGTPALQRDAGLAADSGSPGSQSQAPSDDGPTAKRDAGADSATTERFSFFVTSLEAMRELSGSENGFGGDLRYGQSSGLAGADKICSEIAERSLPGAGAKGWHAFLSAKAGGPDGGPVHARDRIGQGPWYDRAGRMVAEDLAALLDTRPAADSAIMNDLPNERGEPNHGADDVDNHDTVTGSDAQGRYADGVTCQDWTSTETPAGSNTDAMRPGRGGGGHNGPMCGHSWPAQSGASWIAAHPAPGCAPSVSLVQTGAGSGDGIGNGGGYGGIYCFALQP